LRRARHSPKRRRLDRRDSAEALMRRLEPSDRIEFEDGGAADRGLAGADRGQPASPRRSISLSTDGRRNRSTLVRFCPRIAFIHSGKRHQVGGVFGGEGGIRTRQDSFRICKLQIPHCQGCRKCQECRGGLHRIAPAAGFEIAGAEMPAFCEKTEAMTQDTAANSSCHEYLRRR
jgi:hypothetical protein